MVNVEDRQRGSPLASGGESADLIRRHDDAGTEGLQEGAKTLSSRAKAVQRGCGAPALSMSSSPSPSPGCSSLSIAFKDLIQL